MCGATRNKAFIQACLGMKAIPLYFQDDVMHFSYTAIYEGKNISGKVWCHPFLMFEDVVCEIQCQLRTKHER